MFCGISINHPAAKRNRQTGGAVPTLGLRGGHSVRSALTGCREGDRVEVYMTYAAAYGSGVVGLVPKESPVAWLFTIEKVTKN